MNVDKQISNELQAFVRECVILETVIAGWLLLVGRKRELNERCRVEKLLMNELVAVSAGNTASSESAVCTYVNYFDQIDRDGLGPTDSILRQY